MIIAAGVTLNLIINKYILNVIGLKQENIRRIMNRAASFKTFLLLSFELLKSSLRRKKKKNMGPMTDTELMFDHTVCITGRG
jgi:hypothetical protein